MYVRLGTCIALELAALVGTAAGLWFGGGRALDMAGDYLHAQEAAAADVRVAPRATEPAPLPRARLPEAPPPAPPVVATVFDEPDDVLLAPLGTSPLTHAAFNHGGTSLSLRLDFASGGRAAFKPDQIYPQSNPRHEIAAYRIDRLLGIGHVAPARTYEVPVADVIAAFDPDARALATSRLANEAIPTDGMLRGELTWWIPEIRDAWIGGHRVDEPEGKALWTSYLQVGAHAPPKLQPLIAQLSAVVVFDVLIDNPDRWTGNNAKVSPDERTLYFMDNTLSFSKFKLGHAKNLEPLYSIQVFPRALIGKVRALTYDSLAAALDLGDDSTGLAPLLAPDEIRAILARRDNLVAYIDGLISQFGQDAVLALP